MIILVVILKLRAVIITEAVVLFFFLVEIYCDHDITTALWSQRWSAYIHPRLVWSQVCGSCSRQRRRREVWRTDQAGVFRKKLN